MVKFLYNVICNCIKEPFPIVLLNPVDLISITLEKTEGHVSFTGWNFFSVVAIEKDVQF